MISFARIEVSLGCVLIDRINQSMQFYLCRQVRLKLLCPDKVRNPIFTKVFLG